MWPLYMHSKAPAAEDVLWARGERNNVKMADFGIRCMERFRAAGDNVTVATAAQPSETWFDQQRAPGRHANVEVGAVCSTTLDTTHSESAAVAAAVVRGYTALVTASTGVEATKRRGDGTPKDGAGAAESESEALGKPAALAPLPAEQRRSDVRYCAIKNHVLPKAVTVTGTTVSLTKEPNPRLLYDLVVESGGQKTVSLLVSHVEASEGTRPYDPRTRSVDVQQLRQDFQDPLRVVTDCNTPSCKVPCENSSSSSVLTGGCTLPLFLNTGQGGKTWNYQGRGSTGQNTDGAEAVAYEEYGRRAENGRTDGVERLMPVPHVTEFKDLALDAALLQNLRVLGFRTPSPVQCALIPRALDGKNLIVQAKSGTGKTLAFALYLLHALTQRFKQRLVHLAASSAPAPPGAALQRACSSRDAEGDEQRVFTNGDTSAMENAQHLQKPASTFEPLSLSAAADAYCIAMALVVTPTRELTIQVANEISRLGWRMRQPHLRHACFFGGRPLSVCHQQLAQKPHVLISTPGRLLGLLRSQTTTKAVAAWPCCCARVVCLHMEHSSHNVCKDRAEEQQLWSDKHTSNATPRGSTCDSRSNCEEDSQAARKEDKRDRKISQVLQSQSGEESCGDPATPAEVYGERLSLSRRLRQRLCIMVLDEADMLLGHLFRRQTKKLLSTILHPRLQLLATSATFPPPYITFLEQLCLSLDSENQRGCPRTALHEPLRDAQNCGTGQSQRMHEGTGDRTALQSVESLVAAAAFIRDHASTAAADVRSAAVEAYLGNLVEGPALGRSASQDEVTECALECSISETMLKTEAACSGAETSLEAERSLADPAMNNRAVHAVNSIIYQPLPQTAEEPRIFEKVMLCSSFVVHGVDSGSTKCERMETELTRRPTLDDLGSAADSLFEMCAGRKVRFQDSENKDPTEALPVEETRVFGEIADCSAPHEDGQRGCPCKQLKKTETKSVRAAAAIQRREQSSEKTTTAMNVQRQLEKSDSADEKGSLFTDCVSKCRDDTRFTVESTLDEIYLNDVSAVEANGSSLKAANEFHPTKVTREQSDVIKTDVPCPSVPYIIQRQSIKPAAEEETSVWQQPAASRLTSSPSTENRDYSSRQMPAGSHFIAPKKRKTESPSLVGINYVIMTVEDEPSLMRQLGAKVRALQHIFANLIFRQAMIFCNQAEAGAQIAACLIQLGIPTLYTSSKLTQEQRVRNLLALKRIDCRVFVCSDVMSRGIDAAAVDLVVNLDVPRDKDIFLHRSGRAGRFGGDGVCVCIASKDEQPFFEYLAVSLKLTLFPSLESLSRRQRERMLLRDGRGEEVVDDTKQKNVFYHHVDCESGSENTGNNGARQDVCAVLSQPAELVRQHITQGRNFECGGAWKPVSFVDPKSSTSASEQRSVADLPDPETSRATIRRYCSSAAATHTGKHVSEGDPTGYQPRDTFSAKRRAEPDTCDRRQRGDSSSYLRALLPASFSDEARSMGERSRLCNYPSIQQGSAERFIESLHPADDVDGYHSVNCAAKDLIDRNEAGPEALLQEGVYKTVGADFQTPFGCEGCPITVESSLVNVSIYSWSPSSGIHLEASDVVQRGESGYQFVDSSASLWGNASVLLQPYEHLRQRRRQATSYLSKNTSVLCSLAASALSAHDRAFCDNAACPSASVIVSGGARDIDHCERQISANPRLLSLTEATSIHSELQNMERRTSHVVAFTPGQCRSVPKACGECFRVLFLEGAATFKEHVQELKDWKTRILPQWKADLDSTEIPAATRSNATAAGYALLHVKEAHGQFWENADAINVSGNKWCLRLSTVKPPSARPSLREVVRL